MEDKETKYFQFDGTNFNIWKFRMSSMLEQKGLQDYITEYLELLTLHASDRDYNLNIVRKTNYAKVY